jgi:hypothetical protein
MNQQNLAAVSNWATFVFSSFLTKTKACPVSSYEVAEYKNQNTPKNPEGFETATYSEKAVSGTVSANTFSIALKDGMSPSTYEFAIKIVTLTGSGKAANVRWSPFSANPNTPSGNQHMLSLRVICPSLVKLAVPSFNTPFITYLGASGDDARYEFNDFIPELEKCSYVTGYEIFD